MTSACGAGEPPYNDDAAIRAPGPGARSLALADGIVIDSGRGVVYIMRPGGGIAALDIDDGGLRWESNRADRPLFVADGKLLAQVESDAPLLGIASLDTANGRPASGVGGHSVLTLPRGVAAGIDDTLARSFTPRVRATADGVYLTWEFIARDPSGVSPAGGQRFVRRERGAFRFSDDTFVAVGLESIGAGSTGWPTGLREWLASRRAAGPVWQAGKVFALAEQRYKPDELLLWRWQQRDGTPLEPERLNRGRALALLASCDERHIVVATSSGVAPPEPRYLLRYVDLDNAQTLAQRRSMHSAVPFCISGSRLLHLSQPELRREHGVLVGKPLELVAAEITSGDEIWRAAIRDISYRGSPPPRPE